MIKSIMPLELKGLYAQIVRPCPKLILVKNQLLGKPMLNLIRNKRLQLRPGRIRCWCWPGTTSDSALIRQVKDDLRDWSLARVVWVADRGFTSAENRRYLQRAGGGYILGEKLRSGTPAADAALLWASRTNATAVGVSPRP